MVSGRPSAPGKSKRTSLAREGDTAASIASKPATRRIIRILAIDAVPEL
jgi:hypothetical protein